MSTLEFNAKPFLEALCKYYMEFIETDFKSSRPPSRRIVFTRDDLVSDVKLDRYPKLNQTAIDLLRNSFNTGHLKSVGPKSFILPFPSECIKKVRNTSDEISKDEFFNIIDKMFDYYKLNNREKHLAALQEIYENDGSQGVIKYLEVTPVKSFIEDIYELWKNKQILDKQSIYLYFCDLKYENKIYPIFYIPIQIETNESEEFTLYFDPVLLVNKKAIEYVTSKWAEQNEKDWKIDLPPRQIYLSNYETGGGLLDDLQGIINKLCNFLGYMEFRLDQHKTVKNMVGPFELSNNCYLSLFDNSDEALLNDYEELLQLILKDDDAVAKDLFEKISTDFLFENPTTFENQIEIEYEEKKVPSRLAYTSPISLNKEQLQVINAINKSDCNRIVIEGPPGTGNYRRFLVMERF